MGLPRGPGFRISDFESNRIIAQLQVDGARSLMNGQLAPVTGSVRSVHTYLDMYVNYLSHSTGKILIYLNFKVLVLV